MTCTRRDAPQVRKTCPAGLRGQETVSNYVCFVPCYPLSTRLLSFSFTFYCVADHAILNLWLFFLLQRNRVESFRPRVLSPILNPQSFCFHLKPVEENGDVICYEVGETILSCVCFLFHTVSHRSLWNTARSRPSDVLIMCLRGDQSSW